jgi:hypothetical protein
MFEMGKRGSEKLFPLFPFSNLFYLFFIFCFIKCKGEQKQIYSGKGEKKMVDLGVRKKFKCNWWKKVGKESGITTGLPPGESFTFIVREQHCLHIFED